MAKLVWTAPEGDAVIDGYVVRFRDLAEPARVFNFATVAPAVEDIEKTLNLVPQHTYAFKVAAFNVMGEGPSTPEAVWEYKLAAPYAPPENSLPEAKNYFVIALPPGLLTQI